MVLNNSTMISTDLVTLLFSEKKKKKKFGLTPQQPECTIIPTEYSVVIPHVWLIDFPDNDVVLVARPSMATGR